MYSGTTWATFIPLSGGETGQKDHLALGNDRLLGPGRLGCCSAPISSRGPGVRGPWASPSGNSVSGRQGDLGKEGSGQLPATDAHSCPCLFPDPLRFLISWQLHGEFPAGARWDLKGQARQATSHSPHVSQQGPAGGGAPGTPIMPSPGGKEHTGWGGPGFPSHTPTHAAPAVSPRLHQLQREHVYHHEPHRAGRRQG